MISAVVLAKNEENAIIDCIESISFCNEILIIDDYSSDRTIEIIENLKNKKVKIFQRKLGDDFSSQRNFGLDKARNDWVLFVDADERVSLSLQYEILSNLTSSINQYVGYFIPRRDIIWGKTIMHGEQGSMKLLRLAKKNYGSWKGKVHEKWVIKGKTYTFNNYLMHLPHQTIGEFLTEINYYTSIRANELFEKKISTSTWSIITYPKAKFLFNFFIRRGFLDGIEGLIVAILMSFHSFLVRAKLWLLWQKKLG